MNELTVFKRIEDRYVEGKHSIFGDMDVLFMKSLLCAGRFTCQHCTYWHDNTASLDEAILVNKALIDYAPLKHDTLFINPSATFFDVPIESIKYLLNKWKPKRLISESSWTHRNKFREMDEFIKAHAPLTKFNHKIGIEAFDNDVRAKIGKKYVIKDWREIFTYTKSVILLTGTKYHTKDIIDREFGILMDNAELGEVNVISDRYSNTPMEDPEMIRYVMDKWAAKLIAAPNIEFTVDPSSAWGTNINGANNALGKNPQGKKA